MEQQLDLFRKGGLEDEGGEIDEVSGNKVPIGGTKKGVRDDIPAMISEGEFVFPEDVVRYIGLDKLMQLRQDAKMGLKKMEAMGQMGNSDEATIPDDLPFDMADLIIIGEPKQKPKKKYTGGVVKAQAGTLITRPSVYSNPPANIPTYTPPASSFRPITYNTGQTTTSGYRPAFVEQGVNYETVTGSPKPVVTANQLLDYYEVEYYNPETGDIRKFTFYKGNPITPIPDGYIPYQEGDEIPDDTDDVTTDPTTTPTTSVRDDNDRDPLPPPKPFDYDAASAEEIVNEVGKINSSVGNVFVAIASVINPAFGLASAAMMRMNKINTLEKLQDKIKNDQTFVNKMKDAGKLDDLKEELATLKEKTEKGGGLGMAAIGLINDVIKDVSSALSLNKEDTEAATTAAIEYASDENNNEKDGTAKNEGVIKITTDEGFDPKGSLLPRAMQTVADYEMGRPVSDILKAGIEAGTPIRPQVLGVPTTSVIGSLQSADADAVQASLQTVVATAGKPTEPEFYGETSIRGFDPISLDLTVPPAATATTVDETTPSTAQKEEDIASAAARLASIQGTYTKADLEAEGYSNYEIDKFERTIRARQETDRGFTPTTVAPPAATATPVAPPPAFATEPAGIDSFTPAPAGPSAPTAPIDFGERGRTDRDRTSAADITRARQNAALSQRAESRIQASAAETKAASDRIAADRQKRAVQAGQMAGKGYVGGYGFKEGGLASRSKKKKVTPKNRGIAARK
jgi:hypothetical protein